MSAHVLVVDDDADLLKLLSMRLAAAGHRVSAVQSAEAALAQLALGNRDSAQQLAEEELGLARSFGGPRSVGVAARSLGIVTGGDQGAQLLREAINAFGAMASLVTAADAG